MPVADRLPANASDPQIVQLAIAEGSVILCFDLDFAALVARAHQRGPSVITFRTSLRNSSYINQRLTDALPELETDLEKGALATVENDRVRIRLLPISPEA